MENSKSLKIVNKSGENVMVNIQIEKSYVHSLKEKIDASLAGGFKGFEIKAAGSYAKDSEQEWKKVDPGFFSVVKDQISSHSIERGSDQCFVTVLRKNFNYGSFTVTSVNGVYSSIIIQSGSVIEDKQYVFDVSCSAGAEVKTNDHIVTSVKVEVGGVIYKYRVVVALSEGKWDLRISDAEGDVYKLWCSTPGLHYVDYNSKNPTIVKIQRTFCP